MTAQPSVARYVFLIAALPTLVVTGPERPARQSARPQQGPGDCLGGDACNVTQVTPKDHLLGHCQDLPGAQEIYVRNLGSTDPIDIEFRTTRYLMPANTPAGTISPPQTAIVSPDREVGPLGCTWLNDVSDSSAPKLYLLKWEWYASLLPSAGTGDRTCRGDPPALSRCSQPADFQPGLYHIVSNDYTIGRRVPVRQSDNTTTYQIQQFPLCLDRSTQTGRFQQLECNGTPAQTFNFGSPQNGCYVFKHPDTNRFMLTDPGKDYEDDVELFGYTGPQFIRNCAIDDARFRWQLRVLSAPGSPAVYQIGDQATGRCLQIDSGKIEGGGRIKVSKCVSTSPEQRWRLLEITP